MEITGTLDSDRIGSAGTIVGEIDLLVAVVAKEHGAVLATRNTSDFEGCGLRLINPWR